MEVFERLAVELHRQYRAAEKALTPSQPGLSRVDTNLRHDHGWAGCHKQKYFQARARIIIKRAACQKLETGLSVSYTAIPFPIEEICALFQVPEILVTGNTGDARRKAARDKKIRETLWPEKKYTVTNAIADPQTGRGVK